MTESIFYERLSDRDLWVDGDESDNIDSICNKILSGKSKFLGDNWISESSIDEVKRFVSLTEIDLPNTLKVKTKESIEDLDTTFKIPKEYLDIDIEKHLIKAFRNRHNVASMDNRERNARLYRLSDELELYHNMGLMDVLKCSAFIVDTMKQQNIVWGPGRGSACCSYVLFLLEVHDIDSFSHNLEIDEFLR